MLSHKTNKGDIVILKTCNPAFGFTIKWNQPNEKTLKSADVNNISNEMARLIPEFPQPIFREH